MRCQEPSQLALTGCLVKVNLQHFPATRERIDLDN
jgi:hypothetical protein